MRPTPSVPGTHASVGALIEAVKRRWRAGADPDAAAVLRDHPELLGYKSVVVDLAYEEFCLREEAGAAPDADAFAGRFPAFRSGVREVVRAHAWLADQPNLLRPEPRWPQPGEAVEGYQVVGEVARGAFARVFLAADPQVGRHVVLKVAPGGSAEARALGQVRHPHVIDVYWAKPVGDLFVICMPFVAAATLQDVCDAAFASPDAGPPASAAAITAAVAGAEAAYAGLLPAAGPPVVAAGGRYADGVAAIALRVAEALAALHRAGVVHADLKPSNVLLAAGGHPYLIDFNLAVGRDADRLRGGGTLPYMPPERLRALAGTGPDEVSPRADVFAFGALVHQLATGRLPFDPGPPADARVMAERLLALHRAGLDVRAAGALPVPGPLADLVVRCLAADPTARPADGEELVRALRAVRPPRVGRRLRWVAAAAVTAGLAAGWAVTDPKANEFWAQLVAPSDPLDRGRYYLDRGHFQLAADSYARAYQERQDGRTAALLSYCYGLLGNSQSAADVATKAIEAGYDTAPVRNNRAYSRVRASRKHADDAITDLDVALRMNDRLRAAHYNMATVLFWRDYDEGKGGLKDLRCVRHMNEALRGGPSSAHLSFEAAQILAVAARQPPGDPDLLRRALDCAREAVALGKDPNQVRKDPVLQRALGNVPEFGTIGAAGPPRHPPESYAHLVLVDPDRGE